MGSSIGEAADSNAEHLPECDGLWQKVRTEIDMIPCICDELRACEQRVKEHTLKAMTPFLITRKDELIRINYQSGYTTALLDAQDAVQGIRDAVYTHYRIDCEPPGKVDWSQHRNCDPLDEVIAAIDALQEERK